MANISPGWLWNGSWRGQTDNRLNDLEQFKASAAPRLANLDKFETSATARFGKLESFEKTAGQSLADLRKFEGDALNRLGKLETFKEKEFTLWKTDTDKRLGELEKKGDCDAWKNKVDGLLGGLEKDKLSIEVYNADKTKVDARLDELEDFKGKMGAIFTRDQGKNESRLEALENRVKGLEEKTTATDTRIDNSLKEVTDRLGSAEKKSEECCKSVKAAIKELGQKVEDSKRNSNRTTKRWVEANDNITAAGQLNHHSPSGVNVRVNHGRDILVNGSGEASQSHTSTLTSTPFNAGGGLLLANSGPWVIQSPISTPYQPTTSTYMPLTPPPTPTPSNSHHIHHHHHRSSRRHSRYYNERDEEDGMYNMQQMPAIHLGFSRTTPGGLFSSGKKDKYQISFGGGGGLMGTGRRRGSATSLRIQR